MADFNGYGNNDYVPYQGGYTIEEFVDLVQTELTISCALPRTLLTQVLDKLSKQEHFLGSIVIINSQFKRCIS